MKLRALYATATLGVIASLTSGHAQTPPSPCTVYLCMAGMPNVVGQSGGPGCAAAIQYWHAPAPAGLAVYNPPNGFNPPASAARRRAYISSPCQGSEFATNAAILESIIEQWGYIP